MDVGLLTKTAGGWKIVRIKGWSPDQPRDPDGKWSSGAGYYEVERDEDGTIRHRDGSVNSELTDRAKQIRVPPAWTGLRMSVDPDNDLQATGKDAKGRSQYLYTAKHKERSSAETFGRVKALIKEMPSIERAISRDASKKDEAAVLMLIRKTGIRIGTERDTKAEKQAYGATTLKASHVKVIGDKVTLKFVGKKGVSIRQSITDGELARVIGQRIAKVGPRDNLFDTDDNRVRSYLHSVDGEFRPKDLRTLKAAEIALDVMKSMVEPKNSKQFAKARNAVGDAVSEKLGNTRSVALKSYIPPEVFSKWKSKLGIKAFGSGLSELEEWADSVHYVLPDGRWDDDESLPENWWDTPDTQDDPDDEEVSSGGNGGQVGAKGGPGSGNFGHSGRPGQVGGSGGSSESASGVSRTPRTEDENDLLNFVTQMASLGAVNRPDWIHGNMEEMIVKEGMFDNPSPRPKDVSKGEDRLCFMNSFRLAMSNPDKYTYVEGMAFPGIASIPMHHAWCVDKSGKVVDPTWPEPGKAYMGIHFSNKFIMSHAYKTGVYGVFGPNEPTRDLIKNGLPAKAKVQ